MILMLRREGLSLELLVMQRLLDERRDAYIAALRNADRGDLTPWLEFFAATLADALHVTARLAENFGT